MQITQSQKIALGLLGIAVAAFVVDQVTGKSISPARPPATVAAKFSNVVATDAAAPIAGVGTAPLDTFASRLAHLDQQRVGAHPVRDAFKPSAKWLAYSTPVQAPVTQSQVQFAASHRLKAVLQAGTRSAVEIDGSLVRIGQRIDGFRLDSVTPLSAVFSQGQAKVTLRLLPNADTLAGQPE